ncbi:MAG: O-antigen ligase family protein [Anaerolineae bacterium]|nr:O-antigen ligase family protein [Anaerolineae bacterium]
MKIVARFIASFEPFLLMGVVIFFWFASNFPLAADGVTGIITAEWLWIVTGLLPMYIAYWVAQTDLWRTLPLPIKWALGGLAVAGYLTIYIQLPFLPIPSYAIDRADWFWMLGVLGILIGVRWVAYGRKWMLTWVEGFSIAILILAVINIGTAPQVTGYIIRAQGWAGLGHLMRPLLGILLMGFLIELARRQGRLDGVLQLILAMSAVIALIGLSATQWTVKSEVFVDIIKSLDFLPKSAPFFRRNSINPNEIGGALAWLVPFCAVILLYPWHQGKWAWRGVTVVVFGMGATAMILGQSRFALIGVLGALTLAFIALLPTLRLRLVAIAVIGVVGILQLGVLLNVFNESADEIGLSDRDERTTAQRFALWNSAIAMIQDYPLTGVGLNNYRAAAVRRDYPITEYPQLQPPHAHNEILQIGADMGIGGIVLFVGLHLALAGYLWITYRRGTVTSRIVAVAVGASILAHGGFSIGDAIPLWDRFHFVFWMMLGVGMASYHLRHTHTNP